MRHHLLLLTLGLLSAQTFAAAESSSTRRLRFAFWERPAGEAQLAIPDGKKAIPIRPYTMCFMDETRYAGPSSFPLLRKAPHPKDAKPEELKKMAEKWETCGTVKLDGVDSHACDVLLVPGPNNSWAGHCFDAAETRFPWGGVRVINLSNEALEGTFNGKAVKIGAKQQTILPHVFQKEQAEAGLLALYAVTPAERKLVLSNAGMFDNQSRVTVFLIKNTAVAPSRYESRSIQEPRPASPEAVEKKPARASR